MALHVLDEANRCLGCKKPLCQQGCPIHTNIPEVIRLLKANQMDAAGQMLFENKPAHHRVQSGVQPREPVRGPLRAQPDAQPRTRCTFPSSRTTSPPPTPTR